MKYLNCHHHHSDYTKVWAARVVMAIATIMRKTDVSPPSESNALKMMLTYLCLKKHLREHVVATMDESLRLIVHK